LKRYKTQNSLVSLDITVFSIVEVKSKKFTMEGDSPDGGRIHPVTLEKFDKETERREQKKKVTKKSKKQSKRKDEEESRKKTSDRMRTSLDVIKRLQWDENLPQDFFTIGYVDRFKGIVEDPFTKFSHWGDLVISHNLFLSSEYRKNKEKPVYLRYLIE